MVGQAAPLPPRKPASEVQNPLFDLASICYLMAAYASPDGRRGAGRGNDGGDYREQKKGA
jgi:hypothetical protein